MPSNFKSETLNAVRDTLRQSPEATVQDIAAANDLSEAEVVEIMDEHRVGNDDKVTYKGPGGGGGWVAA